MEKITQHGGARSGAGRKKGSTTNNTGYKNGRIVISCLESEEMAIRQKAKEQNITVSKLIIYSVWRTTISFREVIQLHFYLTNCFVVLIYI